MNQKTIVKLCKELGCCDACCVRYLGLKNPSSYDDVHQFVLKYLDTNLNIDNVKQSQSHTNNGTEGDPAAPHPAAPHPAAPHSDRVSVEQSHGYTDDGTDDAPPVKRIKLDNVCTSCLGVLQEETWLEGLDMVQDVLHKKCYECESVACALSSPIAAILRERAITLHLQHACTGYDHKSVMPLKEAWKWLFGRRLASVVGKRLDSGAVAPLLVTLTVEYPDDLQELEVLRTLSPALFAARNKQRRRFAVEFTRRSVEQALEGVTREALCALTGWARGPPPVLAPARPVSALAARAPLYVGGRYVKLSRALPQTPWLVGGRRALPSSVQEIICEPLGALYGLSGEEVQSRIKFIAAGREDVDVRCLGTGRPFALEVCDARRVPAEAALRDACERISAGGEVCVRALQPLERSHLALLTQGERARCKTYEALCVKLKHAPGEEGEGSEVRVTPHDLARLHAYRNTPEECEARVLLSQRTPLRVLHRRPLLSRARHVYSLSARAVEGAPALLVLRVRAEAGTYVKEWVHGELRRTRPSLSDALGAPVDILALDVADVELPWPPAK